MKIVIAILLAGSGTAWPQVAVSSASLGPQSLAALLEEAKARNPEILSAKKAWEVQKDRVLPAWTWQDPTLGYGYERLPSPVGYTGMTMYSVSQKIPFPGKLSAESGMKYHEAQIAYQKYLAVQLDVLTQVKLVYHQLFYLQQSSKLLRREAMVLEGVARAAEALVASGRARADEPLLAELRSKEIGNDAYEKERQIPVEEAALNALLSRPPGTEHSLAPPADLDWPAPPTERLENLAREKNPHFLQSMHLIHHADVGHRLGLLAFAPDFEFNYQAQEMGGKVSPFYTGLNLSIPLWAWKQSANLDAARRHEEEAQAGFQAALNNLLKDVRSRRIVLETQQRLALSYRRELLPLARSAFDISLKNYETGRESFARFSDSFERLLKIELGYDDRLRREGDERALLEKAVGADLGEIKP